MSSLDMEHSIDISYTPSLRHPQTCAVDVIVSETHNIVAEVSPGDFHVLDTEGYPEEYSIPTMFFSFADLHSSTYEQQLLVVQPCMHPETRQYLAETIVEYAMNLESQCAEDDVNLGFVVDARLDVEYFRVADEEELAPYRLFDEMDHVEDDMDDDVEDYMDDDEANLRFKGVEKGIYSGGDGKEEIVTCSVCLEDLSSGMEFNRLPCSHIFHASCIGPWFQRNRSCPNCRNKVEDKGGAVVALATLLRTMNDRGRQV